MLMQDPVTLAFYEVNTFPVPTTGIGPYLLQPGVAGAPMVAGGMPSLPNSNLGAALFTPSLETDPVLLAMGVGLLLLAFFKMGDRSAPKRAARKRRRLKSEIELRQQKLKEIEKGAYWD